MENKMKNTQEKTNAIMLYSALNSNVQDLKNAINAGADVNVRTTDGETALHIAIRKSYEFIPFLIESGADVNARDKDKKTPLHKAVINGFLKSIQILIEAGADVNARDIYGNTPLHLAGSCINNNKNKMVQVLIDAGAVPTLVDENGNTPEEVTMDEEIKNILRIAREQKELHQSIPDPVPNSNSRRRM